MKYEFSDYAHDTYEDAETVEMLVDKGWDEKDATLYADSHKPMYEVEGRFEYDPKTNQLTVVGATIEGVRLAPEKKRDPQVIVEKVLSNLNGRGGFDHWWGDIERNIREEIFDSLVETIGPLV
jgi:hypothetical protein